MRKPATLVLTLSILASQAVHAQAPAAPATAPVSAAPATPAPAPAPIPEMKPVPAKLQLKDGETFLFLGDSITHQCLYTQYVEDYFYTRYPQTRIHFYNAGVGGDRAQDALDRFDKDVAEQKPTYVTILLGMNDGAYQGYNQPIFDSYQKGMTAVLEKLSGIGAAAIPMTPTMFDSRADMLKPKGGDVIKETYYNGVLSLYGSWLREQSYNRGLQFVDMWSPLNNITADQRRTNPKWTMIGDAVHPGPAGHAVMATAVLNDIVAPSEVSALAVGKEGGKWSSASRSKPAQNIQGSDTSLSFEFTEEALPWVLPPDAADGFRLTKAPHRFSREKLVVRDLAAGDYDLKIDGTSVGKFSASTLAAGVELQENDKTPQYQQALKVALLNKDRNDKFVRPMRNEWASLKGRRRDIAKAPDVEAKRAEFEAAMPAFMEKVGALAKEAKVLEDQIYTINKPASHKYEFTLVK